MDQSLPLSGLRVLDLGKRPSTAWCARLSADYGAEVIGVEDEQGHPVRSFPPFAADGDSTTAAYLLANRIVTGPADAAALVTEADVIITDAAAEALAAANPRALIVVITPFGVGNEMSDCRGNDLTACALSSWAYVNGYQGRAPLKCSGLQASYQVGTLAFGALVAGLIERNAEASGGQTIDISERDVLVSTASPAPLRYQYSGFLWSRRSTVDMSEGPVPIKDGWFALTISRPAFWVGAMEVLGLKDLAEDKELQQTGLRHKFKDRFVDRVGKAMADWNRMDRFQALGDRRVIAGPVLTMDELADNPQFLARGFFRTAADGTRFPGPFARMGKTGWKTPPGGTREPTSAAGFSARAAETLPTTPRPPRKVSRARPGQTGPLAGFRGLVLTQAWAGTYATQLLGLLGADVIQLETRGRLDSWRGTYQNPIPRGLTGTETARNAWNCSPLYNSVNLNKRCITVDLAEPDGVALFRDLVVHADFVAENFSPRVMKNLGIDYDALARINPDVILASLSAYGAVGPWAAVPGIGGTIEPSSGMSALLGYPGEHPTNSGQMYPDPVAGLCGFAAISLALLHRDLTGEGQYIDLSMQEANFTFIGDAWMEYEKNRDVRGPLGNTHPLHAPHGIYPADGEDQWIAIASESDQDWAHIASLLGIEGFAHASERKSREAALDKLIGQATRTWDRDGLALKLRTSNVIAAAVLSPSEVVDDESLRDRGLMVRVDHPEAGQHWQAGVPAQYSRTPGKVSRPAPLQGEHSREVFSEFLGMHDDTFERLQTTGITGKGPSSKSTVANQA
jgi:crotonobetainyl-CoA:carnitine CoA-transferase CaiB-like acyl-CoA transferase